MNDMTLKQARELKREAEYEIEKILNDFQKATGCKVESVRWSDVGNTIHEPEEIGYLKINARLGFGL